MELLRTERCLGGGRYNVKSRLGLVIIKISVGLQWEAVEPCARN